MYSERVFKVTLLFVSTVLLPVLFSMVYAVDITKKSAFDEVKLASTVLNEDRYILVNKPKGYQYSKQAYPVLYLLDGDTHIAHITALVNYLTDNLLMPEMLIVAITNTDRVRDFTPALSKKSNNFPQSGGADNFLRFIETEVMPAIKQNYRTQDYHVLIGHSFGGLLATHSLLSQPALFDAHISISPALWWDDSALVTRLEKQLLAGKQKQGFYAFSVANEEGKLPRSANSLAQVLSNTASKGFVWSYKKYPEENHSSVHHIASYDALRMLFKGWLLEQPETLIAKQGHDIINKHYNGLSNKFGFDIKAPQSLINWLAYHLLKEGDSTQALLYFQQNAINYNHSPDAFDSLGDGYSATGDRAKAKESYQRACKLAKEQKHHSEDWFCRTVI